MGETTGIGWCHHTRNYWMGCTKVGPGCDFCYAERDSLRWGRDIWGDDQPRTYCGDGASREVRKWNRKALAEGIRRRLFVNSFSDVLDHRAEQAWRDRIVEDAWECTALDFLLLTKRIGNAPRMLPAQLPPNVWLGISAVNRAELHRDTPKLKRIKARVHWLSYEPALGPLAGGDLRILHEFGWIVWGGESGSRARPVDMGTLRNLHLWRAEGHLPPLFVKQFGELHARNNRWKHPHGAAPSEWPAWARIQEFPPCPGGAVHPDQSPDAPPD